MHQLLLLRHAKSSWDDQDVDDHDRPLAPRGRKAASKMAERVAASNARPDLILCSSARRAVQTLKPVAEALGDDSPVSIEDSLYTFDASDLIARLRAVAEDTGSVLLIGHNPAMQDLTLRLAAGGAALASVREKFPTAALAVLELERRWDELTDGSATLVEFVTPRGAD